jgi:hypothetical protein
MGKWLNKHWRALLTVVLVILLACALNLLIGGSCSRLLGSGVRTAGDAQLSSRPATIAAPGPLLPAVTPGPASKNFAGEPGPTPPPAGGWQQGTGALVVCGAGGNTDWSTIDSNFQVICRCSLSLPRDGWVFISAGGSLAGRDCEYEAHFRLGIDDAEGDPGTDRWADIYGDSGDGMDTSVALSTLRPLKAGPHTFYFVGRRAGGTGTVLLYDASLAVIACGAAQ